MYLPGHYPELIELLLEQYNTSTELLAEHLPDCSSTIELLPKNTFEQVAGPNQIGLITEGFLQANWADRTVFILHTSDLVYPSGNREGVSLIAEDPTTIKLWDKRIFFQHLSANPAAMNLWQKAILLQNSLFIHAYAATTRKGIRPNAGFSRFVEGDMIIQEGDDAEYVYTLLRGTAKVTVKDGVEVGWIEEGEIFGAIAALTGQPRTATVLAASACTVMTVPRDQFVELMNSQPETCMQLIRTMAQKITYMNQQLVDKKMDYN